MILRNIFRRQHVTQKIEEFNRCLKLPDLILLSITSSIGSGIYVLTGIASKNYSGQYTSISYLLAALPCIFSGLCYAEFSARVNTTGAAYSFVYHSLGELFAFLTGWTLILGGLTGISVTSLAWSRYFDGLFDNAISNFTQNTLHIHWDLTEPFSNHLDIPALCLIIVLFIIASFGVRLIAILNNTLAILNMALLSLIIFLGFLYGSSSNLTAVPYTNGIHGILQGSTLVLYAYLGFESSSSSIAEAKNPSKSIPVSMIISLSIICVLYSLTALSLNLMVPFNLVDTNAPFASAFKHVGQWAHVIFSVGPVVSLTGTLLSTIYGFARYLYSMSNDGLIFGFLSKIHPKLKIPLYANLIGFLLSSILITAFDIKDLIGFSNIAGLLIYALVSIGILVVRYCDKPRLVIHDLNIEESGLVDNEEDAENIEFDLEDVTEKPLLSQLEIDENQDDDVNESSYFSRYQKYRPNFALFLIVTIFFVNIILSAFFNYFQNFDSIFTILLISLNFLLFILLVIFCKQNNYFFDKSLSFRVPFVPFIPILSIILNILLVMSSDYKDWISFVVIIVFAFFIYIFYSYRHSKLH